jgi:hypothetical protein
VRVASGSVLDSSVCVIHPYRPRRELVPTIVCHRGTHETISAVAQPPADRRVELDQRCSFRLD